MSVSAIVAAAGQGRRMGGLGNKQLLLLGGKPVLARTLEVFESSRLIDEVVLLAPEELVDTYRSVLVDKYGFQKVRRIVPGGLERQDSVYKGLEAVDPKADLVLVHDGARPLVTVDLIRRVVDAALIDGAAGVAVPVKDTVKRVGPDLTILETPPRDSLWLMQTPQVFSCRLLFKAYQEAVAAGFRATDDSMLVERLGVPVRVIPGSYENIKITTPGDLALAEAILAKREKGSGNGSGNGSDWDGL